MTVTITVSDVRAALFAAARTAGASGPGAPSTALLGQWFHEGFGQLLGDEPQTNALAALEDVEPDFGTWKRALADHAYSMCVGPRLTRHQAALHDVAEHVLGYWQATRALCDWLVELAWAARSERASRREAQTPPWQRLTDWIATEEPLSLELREPGWSESVQLVGSVDALLHLGDVGQWCAIELKLGQTRPEVDLGQACLYHLMLSAADGAGHPTDNAGTLALVSFRPERHEQLFRASELTSARQKLIDLIGSLAGVVSPQPQERASSTSADRSLRATEASRVPESPLAVHPNAAHLKLGRQLVQTFAEYGVSVSLEGDPVVGPTFLRFPIALGHGVKVKAVERLAAELQLKLGLEAEPFISRQSGREVIDVQRPDRQVVSFASIRAQLPAADPRWGSSRLPIGIDLNGQLQFADFANTQHAHLLVAGSTGSGKSEWLRMAIAGLLLGNTPETLRLLVIDPKRNAFHALRESPFLWRPIVFPDDQSASRVLHELADEMDRRYQQMDGADSHIELVARSQVPLPRIVCVCEEFFDLIQRDRTEGKRIEEQIFRLGAKARAAGIHLMLVVQQPSRTAIKGSLDANIPARVGLKMGKAQESRMLFGEAGAEQLLGRGDLLFKDIGPPRRLQAPLLSANERDAIFGGR